MSQGDLKDLGSYSEWIYKNRMKVIGEFVCDRIEIFEKSELGIKSKDFFALAESCVKVKEMREYIGENKIAYGWHISKLKLYDKPKELSEFYTIAEIGSDCCCGCVWHETPLEEMPCRTCTGGRKYLYRPPQSYMFVEEVDQ